MQSKWNSQNALQIMIFFGDMGFTKEAVRNRDVLIESRERNAFMSKEL